MPLNRFGIIFGLLAAILAIRPVHGALKNGQSAPNIVAQRLDGTMFNLAKENLRDNVLVSFTATWCKPCLEELGEFKKMREAKPDIQIFMIFLDEDAQKVVDFQRQHDIPFVILHDAYQAVARRYEIAEKGEAKIPYVAVFDKKKKVIFQATGANEASLGRIRQLMGVAP